MNEQLMGLILQPQTAFFGLFVFLFFYTLKDGRQREMEMRAAIKEASDVNMKSMDTIQQLTSKLSVVDEIKQDVKELKVMHTTQTH